MNAQRQRVRWVHVAREGVGTATYTSPVVRRARIGVRLPRFGGASCDNGAYETRTRAGVVTCAS
jgi:hypothetical protein